MKSIMTNLVFIFSILYLSGCGSKKTSESAVQNSNKRTEISSQSSEEEAKLKKAVTEGDTLWDMGFKSVVESKKPPHKVPDKTKFDEAFEKYMIVVNSNQSLSDRSAMARVYGRVIDVALDRKNNKGLAKEVAIKSLRKDILPVCDSSDADQVFTAARKVLKAEDEEFDSVLNSEDVKGVKKKTIKSSNSIDQLKKLSFEQIIGKLGLPDEECRSTKKPNIGLAIWETGENMHTVVHFIETIDGSNKTLVLAVYDNRSKSIVENMKRSLDKGLK